ncbi:MAG: glutathione S-transferase family protein [Pseudomonadota bacterium]
MVTLYHHGSSVCAAKVRLTLYEKGVSFDPIYLDILKGDQFDPDYLKLNPKAVVPTLVHNGHVLTESTLICEYIEEAFDGPNLAPADPVKRHSMRTWGQALDVELHIACGVTTFVASHRHTIKRLGPEGVEEFLNATPEQSVTSEWRDQKRRLIELGFDAPDAAGHIKTYDRYLQKMDDKLADSEWLVGDDYTLADINMVPYVNRLDMLSMSGLWEEDRPHLARWWSQVKARPHFKECILDWCPEDLTSDLKTFGAESYPDVQRVLGRKN